MLLECNEIKLLIVNLNKMSSDIDDDLSDLIDFKDCVFILSDKSRAAQLQEDIEDFSYVSPPSFRFGSLLGSSYFFTISRIMREHDVEPYEVVYITGDPQEAYNDLGISTVLLKDEEDTLDKNNLPDHYVTDISSLIKCLKGTRYGYYGELCADGTSGNGWFLFSTLSNELVPSVETDLVVFGRYFVSHDSRAYIHPLSQMILQIKNGKENQVNAVAKVFARSVNFLYKNDLLKVDMITVVPPKLDKRNVLLELINKSKDLGNESLNAEIKVTELLRLKENYKPQKEAGNYTQRYLNVKGKFLPVKKVSGHIVLVDDIITSGATALECAKMLYQAGAEKVTVLVLGASQNKSEAPMPVHLKCDRCEDGEYKIRFGRSAFYGCTNYPKCKSNITYEQGRKRYNASRNMHQSTSEDDDDDPF